MISDPSAFQTQSKFEVGIAGRVLTHEAGAKVRSKQLGLQAVVWGRGFEPREETAIYADTPEQVKARYRPVPNTWAVPISVVYKSIPGVPLTKDAEIKFRQPTLKVTKGTYDLRVRSATVNFDPKDNQPYVKVFRYGCPPAGSPRSSRFLYESVAPSKSTTTPTWTASKRMPVEESSRFCLEFKEKDTVYDDDIDRCSTPRVGEWPFESHNGKMVFRLKACGKRGFVKDVVLELTPD